VTERFLLDRILEPGSLSVLFQPVLEVHGARPKPHYLEALIRGPRGTSAENPSILFEYARKKSRESAVDRACIEAILDAAKGLPADVTLGINVHASTLAMDPGFVKYLATALEARGLSPRRLIVEVVEHAPPWDVKGFRNVLKGLRGLGVLIALDDVGLGHSNYMMILECRPDYFKVDRHFVDGCHKDFHRRSPSSPAPSAPGWSRKASKIPPTLPPSSGSESPSSRASCSGCPFPPARSCRPRMGSGRERPLPVTHTHDHTQGDRTWTSRTWTATRW